MRTTKVSDALAHALEGRRLLTHPFYRRWEAGELAPAELTAYAGQYRYFEAALPGVLAAVVEGTTDPTARAMVQATLDDELGRPTSHLDLFDGFARAVDAPLDVAPGAATQALANTYAELVELGPLAALAGVAAYEFQSPEIAASKADGLRRRYHLDAEATAFWDVHSAVDETHREWMVEALAAMADDDTAIIAAATAAADAWWAFLDERQGAALPAA
jgi:pyrroloquinoline-quinone synthase